MLRLIYIVLLPILVGGSVEPVPFSLRVKLDPFFRKVVVEQEAVTAGQEQNLHVVLNQSSGTTIIFRLVITYPGGVRQEVLDETLGSEATLSWVVPADVGSGMANFELTSSGCGCGERTRPASPTNLESKTVGWFRIQ